MAENEHEEELEDVGSTASEEPGGEETDGDDGLSLADFQTTFQETMESLSSGMKGLAERLERIEGRESRGPSEREEQTVDVDDPGLAIYQDYTRGMIQHYRTDRPEDTEGKSDQDLLRELESGVPEVRALKGLCQRLSESERQREESETLRFMEGLKSRGVDLDDAECQEFVDPLVKAGYHPEHIIKLWNLERGETGAEETPSGEVEDDGSAPAAQKRQKQKGSPAPGRRGGSTGNKGVQITPTMQQVMDKTGLKKETLEAVHAYRQRAGAK